MKHKDVFPNVAAKGLKCPMCAKEVQIHRNLVEHVVLAHSGNPDEYKVEKVVFHDRNSFEIHRNLVEHVVLAHSGNPDEYKVEKVVFHDRNSFEEWRLKTEKKYGIRWVIASSKSFVSRKVKRFRCDKALPTPKYVAKRPRSKKIVSCCTAFMEVIERGNTLEVQYCRTHCGHGTLFDVMNTCHEADPAPLLPLEPDVDISVETDINLLQSNWDLLDHFDADVAALRSKLILLSKLPQRDVNEHLSRIRETIKDADNSTSVMCSSYGIPDCSPTSRTGAMVPPEPVNSGASSTREEEE
ncbi:hypothetical protein COOONC_01383 [Cooperia oncophora]